MKVVWAIPCQMSITDRDTNNISLVGIIEEISIPADAPLIQIQRPTSTSELAQLGLFELVILCARSDESQGEKGEIRLRILDPRDEELHLSQASEVDMTSFLRVRVRVSLPGFPSKREGMLSGTFRFIVQSKTSQDAWEDAFEAPIRVVVQGDSEA